MKTFKFFAIALLFATACSKDQVNPAGTKCYKDVAFNQIKSFGCYTDAQVKTIQEQKLRGQTTLNLQLATDADKAANPDACTSCR